MVWLSNTRCSVAGQGEGTPLLGAVGGPEQGHGAPQVRMETTQLIPPGATLPAPARPSTPQSLKSPGFTVAIQSRCFVMSQGADTVPEAKLTLLADRRNVFFRLMKQRRFRILLPQVHPVQKRRLVRQTARRAAAVQGRPSRLEVPAGLHRQPPQLRGAGVQGERTATSRLRPAAMKAVKVFRCCCVAVSVSNAVFSKTARLKRSKGTTLAFPTPPPRPATLPPLSPVAGASGIEWTSSPVAPDWFVRLSLQVVLGGCEADRLLLVP